MKVVVTGSTGFIGAGVLQQCLQKDAITSVTALVRREMPDQTNLKLKQVIMKDDDFLSYPESVMKQLEGAEACIWALGANSFPDDDTMRRISFDYPHAAAKSLSNLLSTAEKPFHFVFCSGGLVEPDQGKGLWFLEKLRHLGGERDISLLKLAQESTQLSMTIAKPLLVLSAGNMLASMVSPMGYSIRVNELGAALVELAVKRGREGTYVNNVELVAKGSEVLRRS